MEWCENKQTAKTVVRLHICHIQVNCTISLLFSPSSPDSFQVYHETWKVGGGGGGGRFTKTGHSPFSSLCSAALRHNKQEMQTGTKADVTTDHLWSGVLVNIRNW